MLGLYGDETQDGHGRCRTMMCSITWNWQENEMDAQLLKLSIDSYKISTAKLLSAKNDDGTTDTGGGTLTPKE